MLEQRIGRAHRMGQKRPVHVMILVTEGTLEENLLATLSAKHELALAALDVESEVDAVDMSSGMDELKRRLEVLLGAKPEAPLDVSEQQRITREAARVERTRKIATATNDLLKAAFTFVEEMLPARPEADAARRLASLLGASEVEPLDANGDGRIRLALTLPEASAFERIAGG